MIEVYSFSCAVCTADTAAKTADVKIIAFDRNRPIRTDVPAPLVMEIKMTGSTAAVQAAVAAGVECAKAKGKYIVHHIIASPDAQTDKMAYLMDINKDKFNKELPKSFMGVDTDSIVKPAGAIGLLEVQGLVASVEGLDTMLKTADTRLIHTEKRLGGRLVTLVITGEVSAVSAAIEAGSTAAAALGQVFGREIIANPHREITKFFDYK